MFVRQPVCSLYVCRLDVLQTKKPPLAPGAFYKFIFEFSFINYYINKCKTLHKQDTPL